MAKINGGIGGVGFLDDRYVEITGDTMTGELTMSNSTKIILGDSTEFIHQSTEGVIDITATNDVNITNDLDVKAEMKGGRMLLTGGNLGQIVGGAVFMKIGDVVMSVGANNIGIVMPTAGSIVSVSLYARCDASEPAITAKADIFVNTTLVFSSGTIDLSSTGRKTVQTTQARNVDSFSAGDVIVMKYIMSGGESASTRDHIIVVGVQLDT